MTVVAEPNSEFVETNYIKEITNRAFFYLKAGYPVHFRGPAGTGKSTLAKHLAYKLARPISLVHGDEEMTTSKLVGGESGYRFKKVRDNFISTVLKEEEQMTKQWVDNRLTEACKYGFTLIYDEFTRSRAEANNVLLSVLQDRMLTISSNGGDEDPYVEVHPEFKAIFTSNPEEYAGTHKSQDALRDRMITLDIDYPDYETEVEILNAKTELGIDNSELIIKIVRTLRNSGECEFSPTIRAGMMIAKTLHAMQLDPKADKDMFLAICMDILGSETSRTGQKEKQNIVRDVVKDVVLENVSNFRSLAS